MYYTRTHGLMSIAGSLACMIELDPLAACRGESAGAEV
jgi:hypothetical protein